MSEKEELAKLQLELSQLNSAIEGLQAKVCPVAQISSTPPEQQCPVKKCSASPYVPDFSIPLLAPGGGDYKPSILEKLGPLAGLIGTWVSTKDNGFNVMPIPEATVPNGFILKNFSYYEEVTFSAIQGKVVNRGSKDEQDCYTLFYEQRVFFSDGPQANELVHAENGSWLHLITGPQGQGTLNSTPNIPSPPAPNPIPPQNPATAIVKQVSVPHGNSILALGSVETILGAPVIPDVNTLPKNAPECFSAPYGANTPSNPNINPNIVLQGALQEIQKQACVVRTHIFDVDSDNQGDVANIPYIKQHSDVSRFSNTLWLEELSDGQLVMQYSQNISLEFPFGGGKKYLFPHIVANTLTKIK